MLPKLNVNLDTLRPELRILEPLVDKVYQEFGLVAICTSTNDGKHRVHSFHYLDAAFDLRVKLLSGPNEQRCLWLRLRGAIDEAHPGLYDVFLEDAGGNNAHIHIEPSPKLAATMNWEEKHVVG